MILSSKKAMGIPGRVSVGTVHHMSTEEELKGLTDKIGLLGFFTRLWRKTNTEP
jgi:hypothetical protein